MEPTPLCGEQDRANFDRWIRFNRFAVLSVRRGSMLTVGPLIKAALCEIQNFHHPQYNPIRNGL
jgi:hypothetical protein